MVSKIRLANSLDGNKKFTREVILRIGNGKEPEAAAKFLRERYAQEGKQVFAVVYDVGLENTEHNFVYPEDPKGISRNKFAMTDDTRITVVGHGTADKDGLKVGSLSNEQVAKVVSRNLFGNYEGTVGKISVLSCNTNANAKDASVKFGVGLMNGLQDKEVTVNKVTTRVGVVQVGQNGRKFYSSGGSTIQTRDTAPIKIRITNGKTEYLTKDSNNNPIWTDVMPEKAQELVISDFDGDDKIYDPPVKGKVMQAGDLEISGALNGQKSCYLDEGSEVSSDGRAFTNPIDDTNEKFTRGDSLSIQGSFVELENTEWVRSMSSALDEINMDKNWIPLIDTAQTDGAGYSKVTMFNEETLERKPIKIKSKAFTQYKQRNKKYKISVNSLPSFSKTSIGMSGSLMGLGGFIYSAIQMARANNCKKNITCSGTGTDTRLAKALEVHAYIGIAEGAFGVVSDSVQIAELAVSFKVSKTAVNQIATISKSTSKFLKFSKIFGNVGMGVGTVGGIVSLGFSAYQLHHATGDARKEYIVQVTVDSVNLAVNIVSIVASLASASAVASAAGPVGFAVAIVGFLITSITSLVMESRRTIVGARIVGQYFHELDMMYQRGEFNFNESYGVLNFTQHAIVKEVDLERRFALFDSQYIYSTTRRNCYQVNLLGILPINFMCDLALGSPKKVMDKSQALNIRCGIGYCNNRRTLPSGAIKVIVLPILPKSYIDFDYGKLFFSTWKHDKGFDIIRRLEKNGRFHYDFFQFPIERIIQSISHEYVKTHMIVRLARETQSVIVPEIPDDVKSLLENKYQYTLHASAQRHTVLFTDGLSLILINSGRCTWVLHSKIVNFGDIKFPARGEIAFAKTRITQKSQNTLLYFIDKSGGQLMVDPKRKTKRLMTIHQTGSMTAKDVEQYLKSMDTAWFQMQTFVTISNYTVGRNFIGNAYYIVKQKEIVYTDLQGVHVSKAFKETLQLLAHVDGYSYFMGKEQNTTALWRTNSRTKKVEFTYHLYCGNEGFGVSKMMEQEKGIVLMQNVFNVSLVYMIYRDTIRLIGIDGKENDIYKMGEACFPSLNEYIPRVSAQRSGQFPGTCLYASTVPVLPVVQQVGDNGRHYWLYMEESTDQPEPSNGVFCPPSKPPRAIGVITPNITDKCADLTLRDIQQLNDTPVYYFFCEKDKQFFYQIGDTAAREVFVPGGITRIDDFGGPKLVVSPNGGMYRFTEMGEFSLAALSFKSIGLKKQWKVVFQNISEEALQETFIPIYDMSTRYGKSLTAWYDSAEDRLVIVSPSITADVLFLGSSPVPHLVWLYSEKRQEVILQEVLDDQDIEELIYRARGKASWGSETLPFKQVVVSDVISAEYMNGGVFVTTTEGVKLQVDHFMVKRLLGVNSTWISNHLDDIDTALASLCEEYSSSDLITCGLNESGDSRIIHNWYHCSLKAQISTDTSSDSEPAYLGVNLAENSLYFFADNQIVQYEPQDEGTRDRRSLTPASVMTSRNFTNVESAVVLGQSLTIHAAENSKLKSIPKVEHVNTLVLSTSSGSDISVEADTWLHYQTIYVTSIGSKGSQVSSLTIHPPDHCLHVIDEFDGDTVIYDPISPRTIILEDFTSGLILLDAKGCPVNNSAVLWVQLCEQDPILLITKRPRFEVSLEDPTEFDPSILIAVLFSVVIITIIIVVVCWLLHRYKRDGANKK